MDMEFEKATRLLKDNLPESSGASGKPILPHAVRVGEYLRKRNYPRDIVLAGLLHDALEFSEMTEDMIKNEFGGQVARIVKANTKNRSIENSDERIEELAARCAKVGEDALIVRAADTIDSFEYYKSINNQAELEYCRKNAEAIMRHKPEHFHDPIFEDLKPQYKE